MVLRLYSSELLNFYPCLVYIIIFTYIFKNIFSYNLKPVIIDTVLAFEEPSYSLKLAYGHKGKVYKFKTIKTTHKAKEKNTDLEFEKQPVNDKYFSKNEYSFKGNYSLEYVPGIIIYY